MRVRKRKVFLVALPVLVAAIIIGVVLFAGLLGTPTESPPQVVSPAEPAFPAPADLLVIPEVPLGPIAILLACFVALLIVRKRS